MNLENVEGFDWDEGNLNKNYIKHKVSWIEAEDIFKNKPLVFFDDEKHSQQEKRFIIFGKTLKGRLLVMSATIRKKKIRVISVRDQNKEEKIFYKKYEK